jgi:phosphate starvation-inducible membrane PsiE
MYLVFSVFTSRTTSLLSSTKVCVFFFMVSILFGETQHWGITLVNLNFEKYKLVYSYCREIIIFQSARRKLTIKFPEEQVC